MTDEALTPVQPSISRKAVFISWQPQNTRSEALAKHFGARICHLHAFGFKQVAVAPLKYVVLTIRTFRILWREQPEISFVLNPPFIAGLVVWAYTRLRGGCYILDSHTAAFLDRKWTWLGFLHRFLARHALVSIVTNEHLGKMVESWGGDYFVIGDIPTDFPARLTHGLVRPHVVVINTFASDEPIDQVLAAAAKLPDVSFSVTGDLRRCPAKTRSSAPSNLSFTGFIPMQDYFDLLYSSDVAVVLTRRNFTMQRGGYESASLEIPIVTSDWPLLRDTFSDAAAYSDNSSTSIAKCVRSVLDDYETYKAAVRRLKGERRLKWADIEQRFRKKYLGKAEAQK